MELWHYTSLSRCIDILNSQELWLSRVYDTNDTTECDWSRQILSGYSASVLQRNVTSKTKSGIIATGKSSSFVIKSEAQQRLDITFNSLVKRNTNNKDQTSIFDHYIFCFSERCKTNGDDGILSMWRGYGGKAPVALVFDREKLSKAIEEYIKQNNHQLFIDNVTYAKNYQDILEPFKNELKEIGSVFENEKTPVKGCITKDFYKAVSTLALLVKHYGFREEREARVVVTLPDKFHSHQDQHFKKLADEAYIKILDNGKRKYPIKLGKRMKESLTKIVLGPGMESKEKELKNVACKNGGIKICFSTIPFREM